jgi:ABC-type multidrug transport system fused ATPase/permease subunit
MGCGVLICGYIRVAFLNIVAEKQCRNIRQALFQSILKKDISYFDTHKTGELNSLLTDDINKIRDGIGDKLGALIEVISTFISCFVISKLFLIQLSISKNFLID